MKTKKILRKTDFFTFEEGTSEEDKKKAKKEFFSEFKKFLKDPNSSKVFKKAKLNSFKL